MMNCGIAMLQASPTAMPRQAIFYTNKNDRIPYFDIHNSLFDILRFKKTVDENAIRSPIIRALPGSKAHLLLRQ
jgi:hypothetical protein